MLKHIFLSFFITIIFLIPKDVVANTSVSEEVIRLLNKAGLENANIRMCNMFLSEENRTPKYYNLCIKRVTKARNIYAKKEMTKHIEKNNAQINACMKSVKTLRTIPCLTLIKEQAAILLTKKVEDSVIKLITLIHEKCAAKADNKEYFRACTFIELQGELRKANGEINFAKPAIKRVAEAMCKPKAQKGLGEYVTCLNDIIDLRRSTSLKVTDLTKDKQYHNALNWCLTIGALNGDDEAQQECVLVRLLTIGQLGAMP